MTASGLIRKFERATGQSALPFKNRHRQPGLSGPKKCQEQTPNELTTRDTAATDGDLMPSESPLTESLLELSDLHCRTFGPCVILSSQFWKRPDRRPHRNGLTWACRVKDCRYAGSSQIFVG